MSGVAKLAGLFSVSDLPRAVVGGLARRWCWSLWGIYRYDTHRGCSSSSWQSGHVGTISWSMSGPSDSCCSRVAFRGYLRRIPVVA